MNAVNLIPADSRKRRLAPSTSWPTLALVSALLVVLVGAVLYVTAANKVTSRQTELAQVTASVDTWRRVAGSYQSYTQTAQQRSQELADIRQLALSRYPWEHLLSQVAGLMPSDASLTTLQATTAAAPTSSTSSSSSSTPGSTSSSSSSAPGSTSSSSSSAPGSTSSSSSSAPAAAGSAASPLPSVQLSGCASSQSTVAQTMVQLHRIEGVSAVTLASSVDSSANAASSSSPSTGSASGSGGSCPFPVQFQMSLAFEAPAATAATSATGLAPGASSPTTSSTGSGSKTASASTNSTGVQVQ